MTQSAALALVTSFETSGPGATDFDDKSWRARKDLEDAALCLWLACGARPEIAFCILAADAGHGMLWENAWNARLQIHSHDKADPEPHDGDLRHAGELASALAPLLRGASALFQACAFAFVARTTPRSQVAFILDWTVL